MRAFVLILPICDLILPGHTQPPFPAEPTGYIVLGADGQPAVFVGAIWFALSYGSATWFLVRDFVWRSDGPAGASFNGGAGG